MPSDVLTLPCKLKPCSRSRSATTCGRTLWPRAELRGKVARSTASTARRHRITPLVELDQCQRRRNQAGVVVGRSLRPHRGDGPGPAGLPGLRLGASDTVASRIQPPGRPTDPPCPTTWPPPLPPTPLTAHRCSSSQRLAANAVPASSDTLVPQHDSRNLIYGYLSARPPESYRTTTRALLNRFVHALVGRLR